MRHDSAQLLAIRALGWLAAEREILDAFLGQSGASVEDLRKGAAQPAFLCAVLDHILTEDRWVLACAGELGAPPSALVEARAVLGGGDLRHWT